MKKMARDWRSITRSKMIQYQGTFDFLLSVGVWRLQAKISAIQATPITINSFTKTDILWRKVS
jgi:hypothetical protein